MASGSDDVVTAVLYPAPEALADRLAETAPGAAGFSRPASVEEMAELYRDLDAAATTTVVVGSGTHQRIGHAVHAEVGVSTAGLDRVISHEPEDLTLTVESGVTLERIDALLGEHRQTAALPETAPGATIGGVIAAGLSGYRRNRFGPTRDRVLEVTLVTGDGRVVTGGARVVKNVSGYDLPRIACGSFGSLGVIVSVCLKLWPVPEAAATVRIDSVDALADIHRPLAVVETRDGIRVYLQGARPQVESAAAVGTIESDGLDWPTLGDHELVVELRVRPSLVGAAVSRVRGWGEFVAQHQVGVVSSGVHSPDREALEEVRRWCESSGGALVVTDHAGPADSTPVIDPWGTPPPALALQRRLIAAFDPHRIVNRGRLPGGI